MYWWYQKNLLPIPNDSLSHFEHMKFLFPNRGTLNYLVEILTVCIYNFTFIARISYSTRHTKKELGIYADSITPDQPIHPHSLICEIKYQLFCKEYGIIDVSAESVALWSDCTEVQAHLELHRPLISEDQCPMTRHTWSKDPFCYLSSLSNGIFTWDTTMLIVILYYVPKSFNIYALYICIILPFFEIMEINQIKLINIDMLQDSIELNLSSERAALTLVWDNQCNMKNV